MPRQTERFVLAELDAWRRKGLDGYFDGDLPWLSYSESLAEPMARIVGALPGEVAVMNTLTVNLHLALATFFRPSAARYKILIEQKAFPSDHYAVASRLRLHGLDPAQALLVAPADPESMCFDHEALCRSMHDHRDSLALVLLPGIHDYTGQVLDMAALTRHAHALGLPIGFDLAHAAGNIELNLHPPRTACSRHRPASPGGLVGPRPADPFPDGARVPAHSDRPGLAAQQFPDPLPGGGPLVSGPVRSSRRRGLARRQVAPHDRLFPPPASRAVRRSGGGFDPGRRRVSAFASDRKKVLSGRRIQEHFDLAGIQTDWREPDVIRAAPVPLYNGFAEIESFVTHALRAYSGSMRIRRPSSPSVKA